MILLQYDFWIDKFGLHIIKEDIRWMQKTRGRWGGCLCVIEPEIDHVLTWDQAAASFEEFDTF